MEGNLRVISCLCRCIIRWSSVGNRYWKRRIACMKQEVKPYPKITFTVILVILACVRILFFVFEHPTCLLACVSITSALLHFSLMHEREKNLLWSPSQHTRITGRHTHTRTCTHCLAPRHSYLRTARSVAHERPFLVRVHHSGQLLIKLPKRDKRREQGGDMNNFAFLARTEEGKYTCIMQDMKLPLHLD